MTLLDAALYYPYVNMRDETWLKQAVLLWDRLYRIVPTDMSPDPPTHWPTQPHDISELEARGILRRATPDAATRAALTQLWRQLLNAHPGVIQRRYHVDVAQEAVRRGPNADPSLAWLLPGQIDDALYADLHHAGLAVSAEGWYGFDGRLMAAYMTSLANELVQPAVHTVTDRPEHYRLFRENTVENLAGALIPESMPALAPNDTVLAMKMAVEVALPKGLEHVPLSAVLDLRSGSEVSRSRCKAALRDLVTALTESREVAPLSSSDLAALREAHLEAPLKALRTEMTWAGVEVSTSLISLLTPIATTATAGALTGPIGATIGAAVGLGIGVVAIARSTAKAKAELEEKPLAWLLEVERKLG